MTTAPMNVASPPPPPSRARSLRGPIHLILALVGWGLFVHWWTVVIGRENPRLIQLTIAIIAVTLFACVVLTGLWTIHNLRLSRRKQPRTRMPAVREEFLRDRLGRSVMLEGTPQQLKHDPIVVVTMGPDRKIYHPHPDPSGLARSGQDPAAGRLRVVR